jgi:uncharacterized protein (DUF983 family)
MTSRPSPGELADRRRPVTEAERRWPECPHCGSGHVVRVGLRMACESCGLNLPDDSRSAA